MEPRQRSALKPLFQAHVDPRASAATTRLLRAIARALGTLARLAGGLRRA